MLNKHLLLKVTLIGMILFVCQTVYAREDWLDSLDQGLLQSQKHKQPLLLDIYADWCGYCRRMQKNVYPDPGVKRYTKKFVRVRLNGEKHPQIMSKYEVRGFPTMVFLDARGVQIGVLKGYQSPARMVKQLQTMLQRSRQEKQILDQIEGQPYSVHWNYKAGLYYYQAGLLDLSEQYFRKAIASKSNPKNQSYRNAYYNLAVVFMDQKKYQKAVQQWSSYLRSCPIANQDCVYARFYRGVSLLHLQQKRMAKADLQYAAQHLEHQPDRKGARDLLAQHW